MKKRNKPEADKDRRALRAEKQLEAKRSAEDRLRREKERRAERERKALEKKRHKAAVAAMRKERAAEREKLQKARAELAAARQKKRMLFYGKIKARLKNLPQGFDYVNYGILPRVELVTDGDRTSVATRLAAAGVTVTDMCTDGGKTRFKIRKKDLRKAIAILDEMCYTYRIGATFGFMRGCAFWLARVGLIAGAVASVIGLYISYGYVWRVSITGNDKLSSAAIESALKRANVGVGRKKSELDPALIVSTLGGLDGIADASCEIVGTTLNVRVLESKDFTVHKKNGAYVSDYDATVTRIVMRSGTAAVARGDVVGRGDVLASGDVYSTTGELLYTTECDAEIYGDVSMTFVADISRAAVEYRRTGRTTQKTVFGLFGHSIGKVRSPYASYETVAHTANYDVLIPLYVTTYTFYETKAVDVERDIDEVAKAYASAKIEEMHFVGQFEYSYNVRQGEAGLYTVHLFLSGETLISKGVEGVESRPEENIKRGEA